MLTNSVKVTSALPCFSLFNRTATSEIYTLSLHDALPIYRRALRRRRRGALPPRPRRGRRSGRRDGRRQRRRRDRKSTRLNSSHPSISYAVFCLKKKNKVRPAVSDVLDLRLVPNVFVDHMS